MEPGITELKIGSMIDVIRELRPITCDELFHYVSIYKAQYLLKPDADFFCGHCNFMNDKLESWLGILLFLKYLKPKLTDNAYHVLAYNLRENSSRARLSTSGYSYFMPYVMCFTPEKDSIYQWRHYTDQKKGGYCFGFDVAKLKDAIHTRQSRFNRLSGLYLVPCFYTGEDDKLIDKVMANFIEYVAKEDIEHFQNYLLTGYELPCLSRIMGAIFTLAPLFKDRKWKRERECRLILKKSPVIIGEAYAQSYLRDVCGHPFNLMESLTISPHGNNAELRYNLESRIACPPKMIKESKIGKIATDYYITPECLNPRYETYLLKEFEIGHDPCKIMSQAEFLQASSTCN